MVSNDSNQKQFDLNNRNEISLVTPIEKYLEHFEYDDFDYDEENGNKLEDDIVGENKE